jgi:hypothetical protein
LVSKYLEFKTTPARPTKEEVRPVELSPSTFWIKNEI